MDIEKIKQLNKELQTIQERLEKTDFDVSEKLQNIIDDISNQVQAVVKVNFADRVRLTDEQLNDVNTMVKNWNDEKSKDRAIEELLELSLSLLHLARNKTDLESLHKEMADVRLALEHLEFKYGNYQKELNKKLEDHSKISA